MIQFFPTNFVASRKVENHEIIKAELMPLILHRAEAMKGKQEFKWDSVTHSGMVTTYGNPCDEKVMNTVLEKYPTDIIWELFKEIVDVAGVMAFKDAGVVQLWWNMYQKGDWAELHSHSAGLKGQPNYSGIYFLDIEGDNTLEFISPVLSSSHPVDAQFHTMNGSEISEGHVAIFPSTLLHHVRPADGRRVTISFNIQCKFPNE
jgi:hypothetical protein